jgi:hypothetical protein
VGENETEKMIRAYFQNLKAILLAPSKFFRDMPLTGGLSGPLAFALVTHWIGSAFSFLWAQLAGNAIEHAAGRFMHFSSSFSNSGSGGDIDSPARFNQWIEAKQRIGHLLWHWMWGTGSIILDPFSTLFAIFFTGTFVYVGARLLVNSSRQSEVSYESAIRLVAYGLSPAILAAFPFVGSFFATLYVLVVTIIGARELYRISNSRAVLVALFPKLLFLGIIAVGLLVFFSAAMTFLISAIH